MIATIIVRDLGWISEQSVKTSSDGKLCFPCVLTKTCHPLYLLDYTIIDDVSTQL